MNQAQAAKRTLQNLHDDVFRERRLERVDDLLSPSFVWRSHALPSDPPLGRNGVRAFASMLHGAFPDLSWQTEEPLGQGDRAVLRWIFRGTQRGPLLGRAATGHPVLVTGIHIARVEESDDAPGGARIVELWQNWGLMGLMQQLGFVPIIGDKTTYPLWDYPEPGSALI